MQVLIRTQERLLRGILGGFRLTQHAVTQIVDVRLMLLDKPGERFVIALLRLENPGKFIIHSRSLYFLYAAPGKKLRSNGHGCDLLHFPPGLEDLSTSRANRP